MAEETSSEALGPGSSGQVAGYQIEAEIGRGGMAIVYRALDVKLGRPVALKVLAPRLAEDESFRRRFIQESRAAAAVDHPHIVPVFEAGEAGGYLFIAMRYVGTGDVRTLLERQRMLPVARAVAITSQVASALDAAHARGLVHRDVKPANLLLAESVDGRADHVYLSDFGLSKQSLAPSGLTSTGQFLGTLDYVAPEQIEGRSVDGRADLYALACATVEMLTGAPPFRREENLALMWAQLSEPPPVPSQRRADLPRAVDQVIGRALAKSPDDRYQTCMDFADALCAAAAAPPGEAAWRGEAAWPGTAPARATHSPGDQQVEWSPTELAYLPRARPTDLDPVPTSSMPPASPDLSAPPVSAVPPPARPPAPPARSPAPPAWPPAPPARSPASPARPSAPLGPPPRSGRPPSRRAPARRRGRAALAVAAAVIALLCLAGLGYKLLYRSGAAGVQPATASASGATLASSPARTVQAYFTAINRHRYGRAWQLGGRNTGLSYASFVSGFHGTAHDAVAILSARGAVVTARLTATQTDGSVQVYQGTYTVSHGQIVQSDIRRTS